MKNNFFKNILFLVALVLSFGVGGVTALTLVADDIIYNPKNSDFAVDNAQDALDQLYDMVENYSGGGMKSVIYLGTEKSYNIKTLYPDVDYTTLTNDNFIVGTEGSDYSYNGSSSTGYTCYQTSGGYSVDLGNKNYNCSRTMSATHSYNALTGVLTITSSNATPFAYFVVKPEKGIVDLGSAAGTYNIKELYPNIDYTKLTVDHFAVGFTSGTHSYSSSKKVSGYCYPSDTSGGYQVNSNWSYSCSGAVKTTKSYDASTGVLTVTASNATPFVYLLKGLM